MITRMKSTLCLDSRERLPVGDVPANEVVLTYPRITLRKQDRCPTSQTDGTDRLDWSSPVFRYTSKVRREILRLFKVFSRTGIAGALRGSPEALVTGILAKQPDTVAFLDDVEQRFYQSRTRLR